MNLLFLPLLLAIPTLPATGIPAAPLAKKGALLLSEDFEKPLSDRFQSLIPTFKAEDGVWKGIQARGGHGAVGSATVAFKDAIIDFKFRFPPGASFNAVCDDKQFKGSHAGHLCRVQVENKFVRLGDDKEGIMRNDIHEMPHDPAHNAEMRKLLVGRDVKFDANVSSNEWHHCTIEIFDDQMRVLLDNKPAGYLRSPGVAHPTKTSFHFTVGQQNQEVDFDELRIWSAKS